MEKGGRKAEREQTDLAVHSSREGGREDRTVTIIAVAVPISSSTIVLQTLLIVLWVPVRELLLS